jgi:hypothetical protein
MANTLTTVLERAVSHLRETAVECDVDDAPFLLNSAGVKSTLSAQLTLLQRSSAVGGGRDGNRRHRKTIKMAAAQRAALGVTACIIATARTIADTTNPRLCSEVEGSFLSTSEKALDAVRGAMSSSSVIGMVSASDRYTQAVGAELRAIQRVVEAIQLLHRARWFLELQQASPIDALHMQASVATFATWTTRACTGPRSHVDKALVHEAARRCVASRMHSSIHPNAREPDVTMMIDLADIPVTPANETPLDTMEDDASCSLLSLTTLGSLGSVTDLGTDTGHVMSIGGVHVIDAL